MVIGGGAENCFVPLATDAAPCPAAAGDAAVDDEGDADGLGNGLSAPLICADDGGVDGGRVAAGGWAAGAVWPQAVNTTTASEQSARRKRSVKQCAPVRVDAGKVLRQLFCHN